MPRGVDTPEPHLAKQRVLAVPQSLAWQFRRVRWHGAVKQLLSGEIGCRVTCQSAVHQRSGRSIVAEGSGGTRAWWYQVGIIVTMAMTLRLSDDVQNDLRARAEAEGVSMQDVARRAIIAYITDADHRDRVTAAAARILTAHADAIERLGR